MNLQNNISALPDHGNRLNMTEIDERLKSGKRYVLVVFETINGQTFSSVVKDFYTKQQAESYQNKFGLWRGHEVMTIRKYYNEAMFAL